MLVSVCIPVRNGARELPHTLANLLTHGRWPRAQLEVVVGDHGSVDRTAAVLADWPEVRRIAVPYDGPNRARVRNRLLAEARGQLVIFLDHDVLASPGLVAAHVDAHAEQPGALVAGLTYGKDFLGADLDEVLGQVDLDQIGRSAELLRTTAALADPRTAPELLGPGGGVRDITEVLAPWRYTWTCNLSARAVDLAAVGGFDEGYAGWGVEDDDLGLGFLRRGGRLRFSSDAWAFHVPHPVDLAANLLSWQANAARMFAKHPCRDFEYYLLDALHGREMAAGKARCERALDRLREVDVGPSVAVAASALGAPTDRRALWFAPSVEDAARIGATDALLPFAPAEVGPWSEAGVRCTSLVGFRTPYADHELESVVLVDGLLLLEPHHLAMVGAELARVSRRVVLVAGPPTAPPAWHRARAELGARLSRFAFAETSWVHPPVEPRDQPLEAR